MFAPPEDLTIPWCWYCGTTDVHRWHQDHVTPRCRGGSDLLTNKVRACPTCNHTKGSLLLEQYRQSLLGCYGQLPVFAGERVPSTLVYEEPTIMPRSQMNFRINVVERANWQAAADVTGLPLSEWIRSVCNHAFLATMAEAERQPANVLTPDQAQAVARDLLAKVQPSINEDLPPPPMPEGEPRIIGVQEHTPGRPLPVPSEPIIVDCTSVGVPVWPGGYKIRHVGQKKRLDFGSICDACNRKWER